MTEMSGIADLHKKRERRARQAPPPRHPRPATWSPSPPEVSAAVDTAAGSPATAAPNPDVTPPAAEESPAPGVEPRAAASTGGTGALPRLDIDLSDPTAHLVSPTVLSIPASIVQRFERARANAPSHTALVLNALREHAHDLPTLILQRRPGMDPQDLFPWRATPGATTETPMPLRIRPTNGELAVMKTLIEWASKQIAKQRPGARATNRSEMVAAALDAYLPAQPAKRKK